MPIKQYTVTYTDGTSEEVTANTIEPANGQYIVYRDGTPAGFIPATNVRSIIRQDDTDA